jgi:hypothetical protein
MGMKRGIDLELSPAPGVVDRPSGLTREAVGPSVIMQGMFGILSGWREQYHRMRRSLERLTAYAEGRSFADSNEARDALFHFFQDAYHLKDWIKNDVPAQKDAVEDLFGSKRPPGLLVMQVCADLCNGTKHLALDRPRIAGTSFVRQHVTVRPAAAGSGLPPDPPMHAWAVHSGGKEYDVLPLARDVVAEWDRWLAAQGLGPWSGT